MGEAKRRKQKDPTWGENSLYKDSEKTKNLIEAELGKLISSLDREEKALQNKKKSIASGSNTITVYEACEIWSAEQICSQLRDLCHDFLQEPSNATNQLILLTYIDCIPSFSRSTTALLTSKFFEEFWNPEDISPSADKMQDWLIEYMKKADNSDDLILQEYYAFDDNHKQHKTSLNLFAKTILFFWEEIEYGFYGLIYERELDEFWEEELSQSTFAYEEYEDELKAINHYCSGFLTILESVSKDLSTLKKLLYQQFINR